MQVHQQGAAGVAGVGDVQAVAAELPDEPAIHSAEGQFAVFGLLAAALANHFAPSVRHSVRLPMTVCVGGILLVGGQTVFEHLLGMKAVLSVVVEFAGGLVFLYLVLKRKR